jgi:putative hydrolase
MPGMPNPFGNIDWNEFMRMLQSPGPVNMQVARATAEAVAVADLETGEQRTEPPIPADATKAFDDVVRATQLTVADATSLSGALSVPFRTVDRRGWAATTLNGLEPVFVALANALARGQLGATPDTATGFGPEAFLPLIMQQLVPLLLGTWAGSMIGSLAHQALGQYDLPLPLAGDPELLFVVRNVDDFGGEWSLPADELRYSLALREVVHGAERSVPWVRERLVGLASTYVGAYEVQTDALEQQFGNIDMNDPSAMAGIEQLSNPDLLLDAMQSEQQRPMLEELQRFVSVLEGYTDTVVARLGRAMAGSHERIDEALRRHRLERGEAGAFVDRLLGLQLDREHYEAGVAFCRGVVERSDDSLDQLNRLWSDESMVPTPAELQAPGLWLARIDLPQS